ncbi:TetR family transcriptional regulator [Arthrobacter sp. ok909]|uniref:TetR family transcriptional regulator n=1 Tax=Arthrobacter sp. ok909 TaxID=1761746 RepID=UPI0020C8A340|nr:TetR family transcriptional regulator [Arthrobacter sp. ok909]
MNTGQPSEDHQPAAAARATGRPATIDPDAVARIALRLFAERGYEQTSMEDIAGAAGIGRKSLYRYFASKADLVWGGIEPVTEAAGRALGSAGDGGGPVGESDDGPAGASDGGSNADFDGGLRPGAGTAQIRAAQIRAGLSAAAVAGAAVLADLDLTRGRLRLIAEHPELASRSYAALAPQRERGRRYLITLGIREDMAGYLCAAYLGATFEAWMQWAAGSDSDPVPYLLAAMNVLQMPDVQESSIDA